MKILNFMAIALAAASLIAGSAIAAPASSAGAGPTTISTNVCTATNGLCAGLTVAQVQSIIDQNKTPNYSPPTDLCTSSNGFCAGMTTAQVQALIDASKVAAYVAPGDMCTVANGKCTGLTYGDVTTIVGTQGLSRAEVQAMIDAAAFGGGNCGSLTVNEGMFGASVVSSSKCIGQDIGYTNGWMGTMVTCPARYQSLLLSQSVFLSGSTADDHRYEISQTSYTCTKI